MKSEAKLTSVKQSYNQSTVDLLKKVLERAERGEITEVIIVQRRQNGDFSSSWSSSINALELVGHLEMLKTDKIKSMEND